MADQITLTIDGQTVTVDAGSTIMAAARSVGISIPHLCYKRGLGLEPTSSCRLCLVELEGGRAPVTACSYPAADGMVVRSTSEAIESHRRMVIDLLLSDHPHDCLTCERTGACKLQTYAYRYGIKAPEYAASVPPDPTPVQDGPAIVYDRSKCILCGRCVQMCHEITVDSAIDFYGRGFDTTIALPPDRTRDDSTCTECGNCIDVCPTDALTPAAAIGEGRVWDLEKTVTTCPYCGCGCQLVVHHADGRIVKVTGEAGLGPSRGSLCVKGRFGLDFIHHPQRLTTPLVRRDGQLQPASWDEALDFTAKRLSEIKAAHGPDSVTGLASAKCSNEENFVFQKFMRAVIGTNNVDHCARLCHASTVAGLARAFGSGAMTNSIDDFAVADAIFIIGSNTTECHPIIGMAIKRAAAQRGVPLIVADPRAIELTEFAQIHMRQQSGTDVALINGMIHVILKEGLEDKEFIAERTEDFDLVRKTVEPYTPEMVSTITGVPAEQIVEAARLYATAKAASIVYSMGITQHSTGTDNVLSLANLAMATGNLGKPGAGVNPLRGQNNVQGACDMAALPNVYPGYQKVDDPAVHAKFEAAWDAKLSDTAGLTLCEMMNAAIDGDVKAMFLMGENPMLSEPDVTHAEKAIRSLEFLAVQDIFLTETAELADVVFPAKAFAEKDGTFTNTERRIQRINTIVDAPGQSRIDWDILADLARRMDYPMAYDDVAAIQDEIAALTPIYGGIDAERIAADQPQWPCPEKGHPGTPYLHKGKFTRGLGKFHPVEFLPAKELPDADFPVLLTTGRLLQHFHTGTMSRRSRVLDELVPAGVVQMNPVDAEPLGVANGQKVKVTSRRGEIEIDAWVTESIRPGTVFIAFHFRESAANVLTIAALDPIAKIPELKVCAVKVQPLK